MTDPVYQKLKADAEVILMDLWRMLRHQAPLQEWQHPRAMAESEGQQPEPADPSRARPQASGLCYFHLN